MKKYFYSYPSEDDKNLPEYTWDEIRKHNTESDLWVVLYGRVYDVTDFQIDHPGGPDVLQDIAGQDATEEFENIVHTEKATKMCKKYLKGKVKDAQLGNLFVKVDEGPNNTGSETKQGNNGGSNMTKKNVGAFFIVCILLAVKLFVVKKIYDYMEDKKSEEEKEQSKKSMEE